MSIINKNMQLFVDRSDDGKFDVEFGARISGWAAANNVKRMEIRVTEVQNWDISKMRSFFHAVVLPAFTKKFNETHSAEHNGIFKKEYVKEFLKAKMLGFVQNDSFKRWNGVLDLLHKPADMAEWIPLFDLLHRIKDPVSIVSTESLSAERYWKFINACEAYYFAVFNDMYQIQDKPLRPQIIEGEEETG